MTYRRQVVVRIVAEPSLTPSMTCAYQGPMHTRGAPSGTRRYLRQFSPTLTGTHLFSAAYT